MKHVIILLLLIGLLSACNHKKEHQHTSVKTNVELNNGERWEANPETTEGIQNMLSLIEEFQKHSSSDYTQLQENLTSEFQTIFKKCTMKGAAHDQLHNYLIPLKKEIDQVSAGNIQYIRSYLKSYPQYFN